MGSTSGDRSSIAGWRAFSLGGLPYTEPSTAWKAILERFAAVPGWPQLPQRSPLEGVYAQFAEGFPGISMEGHSAIVNRRAHLNRGLERLYLAYLEDDAEHGRISAEYASGLDALLKENVPLRRPLAAIKGQITGPVSWGLSVVDQNRRPIIYDQVLQDAVGKHLRLKAAWQERALRRFAPQTIMLLDEPYMASFGSTFIALSRQQVVDLLEEVLAGLQGLKGVHCCGSTDWSLVLSTSVNIISLDAYEYVETLVPYAADLSRFLKRGGIVAWGIVPASIAAQSETAPSLVERLHAALEQLAAAGVAREALLGAGMVTPSCGLGGLDVPLAERILDLTRDVSAEMQRRYARPAPEAPETTAGR